MTLNEFNKIYYQPLKKKYLSKKCKLEEIPERVRIIFAIESSIPALNNKEFEFYKEIASIEENKNLITKNHIIKKSAEFWKVEEKTLLLNISKLFMSKKER